MLRRRGLLLMQPQRSTAADWPAVRDLLVRVDLPLDGAEKAFETGLVAVEDDRLVGCAAVETFDGAALLRSVAVTPQRQGSGIGTSLVQAAEALARQAGAGEMISLHALALAKGMSVRDLAGFVAPYPTLAEIGKRASVSYFADATRRPLVRWIVRLLRRFG